MLMIDDDVLLREVTGLLMMLRMRGKVMRGVMGRAAEGVQMGGGGGGGARVVVGDVGGFVLRVVLTDDGGVLLLAGRRLSFV